jgi:DNA-binding transcriptional regulator YiaG
VLIILPNSDTYYTNRKTLSSTNFTDRKEGIPAPTAKRDAAKRRLAKSVNTIVELCDGNQSEVARRLGVAPALVNRWRDGENAPPNATIKLMKYEFGIPEMELRKGILREQAEAYFKPLPGHSQKLLQRTEILLRSATRDFRPLLEALIDYAEQCEKDLEEK